MNDDTRYPSPDGRAERESGDDALPLEIASDAWDAFLPDEDTDPLPEPGDFWIEREQDRPAA